MIHKFLTDIDIKGFNKDERSFTAWASRESIDRDEEVLTGSGWIFKNYRKNPVVPLFHDYRQFPMAKSLWEKMEPKIKPIGVLFKPQFAETALGEEALYLYENGFMNAFSVGFDPLEWEVDGETYSKQKDGEFDIWQKGYIETKKKKPRCTHTVKELLEVSGVLVPAHPDALVEVRSHVETPELVKYLDSMIQKKPEGDISILEREVINLRSKVDSLENLITKPDQRGWDETETSFRYRIRSPELFSQFRTKAIKKDKPRVSGVYGKLKDKDEWKWQSLIFPKEDDWTLADAKKWLSEHEDLKKDFDDTLYPDIDASEFDDIEDEIELDEDELILDDIEDLELDLLEV